MYRRQTDSIPQNACIHKILDTDFSEPSLYFPHIVQTWESKIPIRKRYVWYFIAQNNNAFLNCLSNRQSKLKHQSYFGFIEIWTEEAKQQVFDANCLQTIICMIKQQQQQQQSWGVLEDYVQTLVKCDNLWLLVKIGSKIKFKV